MEGGILPPTPIPYAGHNGLETKHGKPSSVPATPWRRAPVPGLKRSDAWGELISFDHFDLDKIYTPTGGLPEDLNTVGLSNSGMFDDVLTWLGWLTSTKEIFEWSEEDDEFPDDTLQTQFNGMDRLSSVYALGLRMAPENTEEGMVMGGSGWNPQHKSNNLEFTLWFASGEGRESLPYAQPGCTYWRWGCPRLCMQAVAYAAAKALQGEPTLFERLSDRFDPYIIGFCRFWLTHPLFSWLMTAPVLAKIKTFRPSGKFYKDLRGFFILEAAGL
jgi:hypothetical protein